MLPRWIVPIWIVSFVTFDAPPDPGFVTFDVPPVPGFVTVDAPPVPGQLKEQPFPLVQEYCHTKAMSDPPGLGEPSSERF